MKLISTEWLENGDQNSIQIFKNTYGQNISRTTKGAKNGSKTNNGKRNEAYRR